MLVLKQNWTACYISYQLFTKQLTHLHKLSLPGHVPPISSSRPQICWNSWRPVLCSSLYLETFLIVPLLLNTVSGFCWCWCLFVCCTAWLISLTRDQTWAPAVKTPSPNHWTARNSLQFLFLTSPVVLISCLVIYFMHSLYCCYKIFLLTDHCFLYHCRFQCQSCTWYIWGTPQLACELSSRRTFMLLNSKSGISSPKRECLYTLEETKRKRSRRGQKHWCDNWEFLKLEGQELLEMKKKWRKEEQAGKKWWNGKQPFKIVNNPDTSWFPVLGGCRKWYGGGWFFVPGPGGGWGGSRLHSCWPWHCLDQLMDYPCPRAFWLPQLRWLR